MQLPEGLPPIPVELVELASDCFKLHELRQKGKGPFIIVATAAGEQERVRLQESEKKVTNLALAHYKQTFTELDKMHTKAIVELKLLLQKMEKLERHRGSMQVE